MAVVDVRGCMSVHESCACLCEPFCFFQLVPGGEGRRGGIFPGSSWNPPPRCATKSPPSYPRGPKEALGNSSGCWRHGRSGADTALSLFPRRAQTTTIGGVAGCFFFLPPRRATILRQGGRVAMQCQYVPFSGIVFSLQSRLAGWAHAQSTLPGQPDSRLPWPLSRR